MILSFFLNWTNQSDISSYIIHLNSFRFPIAIKTSSGIDFKQNDLILDEAKNMIQLTKYHDHIVNLQGLTYTVDERSVEISSVRRQSIFLPNLLSYSWPVHITM